MGNNTGQTALIVVGTVVGTYFGYPGLGMTLGSLVGQVAFPTDLGTVKGPRLGDLNVQTSMIGAPIPLVYGTYAVSGNVIWSSGIIESVKKKRQGGKGGPTQTIKTYHYSVNCAVGICEGEIGGIRRIWADAKLIYDGRDQLPGEAATDFYLRQAANAILLAKTAIYTGTETQEADPTIESYEGAGQVSGFRGLAYVVFSEFQLEDYGNRIPNFRFEVASGAVLSEDCAIEVSGPVIHPWLNTASDPRNPLNTHTYGPSGDDGQTFEEIWASFTTTYPGMVADPLGWSHTDGNNNQEPIGPLDYTNDEDAWWLYAWFGYENPAVKKASLDTTSGSVFTANLSPMDETIYHAGTYAAYRYHSLYFKRSSDQVAWPAYSSNGDTTYAPSVGLTGTQAYRRWSDRAIRVTRLPSAPEGDDWTLVSGAAKALTVYDPLGPPSEMGTYASRSMVIPTGNGGSTSYRHQFRPTGVLRIPGQAEYDDETWWTEQYAHALAADAAPLGQVYGVDYPTLVSEYYWREVCSESEIVLAGQTTLGAIVADLCARCGLTAGQIDVSDLGEVVLGYAVTRTMSARDAIDPLRAYGWFDCVESNGALTWPTRGKAAVVDLTSDDLAAHASGETRPSAINTQRGQEVELPRRLRIHYAQSEFNYEPGEQSASRLAAGNVEVRDLEVAVSMSDAKAQQIADVVLYDVWVSRNRYRLTVDHSHLDLEPADAITAPVDGRQERLRIISVDHALPGLLRLECVRDDDGVYQSYGIGNAPVYSGTGGGSMSIVGESDLVLLDLPALRDEDNDAGYYAAAQAVGGNSFGGAVLFRSSDGGTTYDEVAILTSEATIGELTDALPSGPTTIIDEGSVLDVDCDDDLESIDETSLLAGGNAAAIGDDGRWEIVQFRDAVQVGSPPVWQLTGLLRGRRGTEWAVGTSQAGDRFVLLDVALARVPMNLTGVGAERLHKGVLAGTSIEDTAAIAFTPQGVALEPFSVVHVAGERDGDDLILTWVRRSRLGQELPSGTEIPLGEESEAYDIEILDPDTSGIVLRTLTATTTTVTYTAAQQAADFGSPLPETVNVRIYQRSASVGRGYPTEATV